ncbi:hypothetical protein BTE77_27810 [Ensifer adhaerens]|nr:hypothetical protein BTE77_27810 [Ensifer adhaerens]
MLNHFDQKQIYEATLHACIAAVRDGFPHLTARDIMDPPHEWFDAALARQVVMHLVIREFRWPKRRVVEVEERSREAINRALRTIDRRLETPRFASHYRHMATEARALLSTIASEQEAA